ncbi:copper transporter [Actinomycetospora sp. TBRC 11914]|uniref:copper transporter n=1 Tax=Actinomycetospora sp. TBRC 11914 TaxID=2729387 RepID=UPI00145DC102|nr:copper transporter [Actinomycetospora sp. TBRC 11914]NMO89314.1 copper transporter [Actinomycetospora sp. TBRC 11914]
MISFRYHVVSVCAVLLALGLGVVLGASSLSQPVLGALRSDRADLSGQVGTLTADRDAARAQQTQSDRALAAAAPALVAGHLQDRSVVLLAAPDAVPADLDAVSGLVAQAGGRVTGHLGLTDAALAPDRADALRTLVTRVLPAGVQLPPTTDAGTLAGALLGSLVTAGKGPASSPAEVGTAFTALADGGFLAPGAAPAPAQVALVVTGDGPGATPDAAGRASTLAHLAGAVHDGGAGTVVASRAVSGEVAAVRADHGLAEVSTVDGVGTTAGRIATVLAAGEQLQGRSGSYGSAPGAAPLPGAVAAPA